MKTKSKKLSLIYEILSKEYPIFKDSGHEWETSGLNNSHFKSLVSVMLSTMTSTKRVLKAGKDLFSKASTPQEILNLSDEELRDLIRPVAHYNRKVIHIKEMCNQLLSSYNGEVPQERKELLKLKGVGIKCADIMMNFNFGENNIAVDTHVHRVLNRLGVLTTKTPEQTSVIINEITEEQYKKHAHEWLIQHGMQICLAKKPLCENCKTSSFCQFFKNC